MTNDIERRYERTRFPWKRIAKKYKRLYLMSLNREWKQTTLMAKAGIRIMPGNALRGSDRVTITFHPSNNSKTQPTETKEMP